MGIPMRIFVVMIGGIATHDAAPDSYLSKKVRGCLP